MSDTEFTGFPSEGLDFLRKLGQSDKAWFDANRPIYSSAVVAPAKAFVAALGERLAEEISPTIVALPKTNGSIGPINNDLRFSPDKSPYKDHLLFRFWDGANKKTAPTFMVRVAADEIGFSSGAAITSNDIWRDLIANDSSGLPLSDAVARLSMVDRLDVGGEQLKRVPKPYADDHPRADLLRYKGVFHVRWPEPAPATITTPGFIDHCMSRLDLCADLHHWFLTNGFGA